MSCTPSFPLLVTLQAPCFTKYTATTATARASNHCTKKCDAQSFVGLRTFHFWSSKRHGFHRLVRVLRTHTHRGYSQILIATATVTSPTATVGEFYVGYAMAEEPRRGPPVVEIVLPTYITKPSEDEKFYPSEVKAVAEKVNTFLRNICLLRISV